MRKTMNRTILAAVAVGVMLAAAPLLHAQEADRTTVSFSDPAKAGWVKAHTINGGITIKGYEGKEVVVEAKLRDHQEDHDRANRYPGMKRLAVRSTGLVVEEQNNVIVVKTESWRAAADLVIQVPFGTSLELSCVNDGNIVVDQVRGEIEAQNVNGAITLTKVSGTALANTTNGDVTVSFARIEPGKGMSFATLNGNVELTLPRATKASLSLRIDNQGDIYSDFEIATRAAPVATEAGRRGKDGRFQLKVDRAVYGSINGGGPELALKTFNGDIVLHEAK
jgi:DUF4097 and DUF4098 domain-containing protein YvlB